MWEFSNGKLKQFAGVGTAKIMFDLNYICENAGKKITHTWYDVKRNKTVRQPEVVLPIAQMKRIMKFICQNCYDECVLDQVEVYLKDHSQTCLDAFRNYRK